MEIALDRIGDAESGAIALLDENTELFEKTKNAIARIRQLEGQLKRAPWAGLGFGALTGAGITYAVTDINNPQRLGVGFGVAGVSALVWAGGHFIFAWW